VRAAHAIAKLFGEGTPQDLKEKAMFELSLAAQTEKDWQEKVYIAEGLKLLRIIEDDVLATLLKLLDDENEYVKLEAGRALCELRSFS